MKQIETGTSIQEVCLKLGIREAKCYNWKKKYGGLGVSEMRRLKNLEKENSQLKNLVAYPSLDKQILQYVLKKCSETVPKMWDGVRTPGWYTTSSFSVAVSPYDFTIVIFITSRGSHRLTVTHAHLWDSLGKGILCVFTHPYCFKRRMLYIRP